MKVTIDKNMEVDCTKVSLESANTERFGLGAIAIGTGLCLKNVETGFETHISWGMFKKIMEEKETQLFEEAVEAGFKGPATATMLRPEHLVVVDNETTDKAGKPMIRSSEDDEAD